MLNHTFFSDARARRLSYTPKAQRPGALKEAAAAPHRPKRPSKNLNALQLELLERLEAASFAGRFWPIRKPPLRRLYFNFHFHVQIFISFTDAATLAGPRLNIQFPENPEFPQDPKDQARARQLLREQFQPAVDICRQLADSQTERQEQ